MNTLALIKTLELCLRPAQQEENIFGAGDLANYSRLVKAFGGEPTWTTLLNQHNSYMYSKYLFLNPQINAILSLNHINVFLTTDWDSTTANQNAEKKLPGDTQPQLIYL